MKGYQTTYLGLFDEPVGDRPGITGIEIPIIQRDYAQGRPDDETRAIRRRFARAVVDAAYGAPDVPAGGLGLDFVYGGVHARKRDDEQHQLLEPLDGQQRLTTLYLLHWYVASRAGVLDRRCGVAPLLLRDPAERALLRRGAPRASPPRRRGTAVRVDHRPAVVPLSLAGRPHDLVDAGDARRDPRGRA